MFDGAFVLNGEEDGNFVDFSSEKGALLYVGNFVDEDGLGALVEDRREVVENPSKSLIASLGACRRLAIFLFTFLLPTFKECQDF